MAKKKKQDYEEEDWFEDDEDWEEEKPKKKKSKKKKEKSYAWVWVAAFIVILIILLLVRYKYAAPSGDHVTSDNENISTPKADEETVYIPESEKTDSSASADNGYVYEEPQSIGDDVVTDDEIQTGDYKQHSINGEPTNQDADHARDLTAEPELFSNIKCTYDYEAGIPYISLRVYNILDEDILISPKGVAKGYNTYFMIRGIVDKDPGCGTEVLHPGQYTECKRIGFDGKEYANLPGTNRISVEVPERTEAIIVECPESPVVVGSEE